METLLAIKTRRSVRKYKDKEIPLNMLKDLVDCARLAPSASNIQPWEFILIRDKKKLKQIAEITDYAKFLVNAVACIVIICKNTKYYMEDGCAATENILIAAKSYNLGSCWIAGGKKYYSEKLLQLLKVPMEHKLVSIISLGYPAEHTNPKKRKLNDVLHLEKF
jgi:nitroreductase